MGTRGKVVIVTKSEMLNNILHKLCSIHDFTAVYKNSSMKELKSLVKKILSEILSLDLVFILRNLPKKTSSTYDQIMSNIASFSGILYNTYEEMEDNNEALGIKVNYFRKNRPSFRK